MSEDEAWVKDYEAIWITIEECLLKKSLQGKPLSSGKYVNPKLITWDGEIRTGFCGTSPEPENIGSCYATGVLKIGSVYRQGSNYHLQVFLKECKYRARDVIFQSLLSDDEGVVCWHVASKYQGINTRLIDIDGFPLVVGKS